MNMKKASADDHSHSRSRLPGRLSPRKLPRQVRSQATVDAILGGATQVLVRVGYERTNTTLIARAAGVSVGTLYQYYPNKDAVLSALLERILSEVTQGLRLVVRATLNEPLAARVRAMVHATLAYKAQNPRLHRVLKTELGRLDGIKAMRQLSEPVMALLGELLGTSQTELQLRDPARAAFIAYNTVEGVVSAALLDAPDALTDPSFAHELSDAVMAMLTSLPRIAARHTDRSAK